MADQHYTEVLQAHRTDILSVADKDDVLLLHLLDHLIAALCIQGDQKELIMGEKWSKARLSKLLDFVCLGGRMAFDALSSGLGKFGTKYTTDLAQKLRDLVDEKQKQIGSVIGDEEKTPTLRCSTPVGDKVSSLASIGDYLFVVRYPSQQQIEVYETSSLKLMSHLFVPQLSDSCKLTSCKIRQCLYVCDFYQDKVHEIKLLLDRWPILVEHSNCWRVDLNWPCGISINAMRNLLITCYSGSEIKEYTTNGELVSTISLNGSGATHPWHAVQLTSEQHANHSPDCRQLFVISRWKPVCDVSIIDKDGTVLANLATNYDLARAREDSAVDKDGSILVADRKGNRILLIDASLGRVRDLPVTLDGGLRDPWCLDLDKRRGRLFVGEYDGGRVLAIDNIGNIASIVAS